jgi:hypothetical protein
MKTEVSPVMRIHHTSAEIAVGSPRRVVSHAGTTLIGSHMLSRILRLDLSAALMFLFSLAWPAHAQTPCPGSESCTGLVAELICPTPGTTLPGNDVTFTWCNANADYFLQMESVPGAHDIFFAFVPAQNFVHLINLPTNGASIYATLWTKLHGEYQTPLDYTYTAANLIPPRLGGAALGTSGRFQFTIRGVTPGRTNVVLSSLNLSNWTSISTNVAVSNSFEVIDPATNNLLSRFYRTFEMR